MHGSLSDSELLLRLHRFVNTYGTKTFSFPLIAITEIMINYFEDAQMDHNWLLSTDDHHAALANFLRTRHCFLQNNKSECDLSVQIWGCLIDKNGNISDEGQEFSRIQIVGDVLSSPHRLDYCHTMEGKLKAFFEPPLLDQTCREYPVNITMKHTGYKGLDLTVVVTKSYPGNVRYEQTFRGRLLAPSKPRLARTQATRDSLAARTDVNSMPTGVIDFNNPIHTSRAKYVIPSNEVRVWPLRPISDCENITPSRSATQRSGGVSAFNWRDLSNSQQRYPRYAVPTSMEKQKMACKPQDNIKVIHQLAELTKGQMDIKFHLEALDRMLKEHIALLSSKPLKRCSTDTSGSSMEARHVSKKVSDLAQ